MKNLKLLFAIFALSFAIQVSAATGGPIKPNAQLRAELVQLIGTDCPFELDKDSCSAEIIFTVNNQGEVIVLSVNSPNPLAGDYIKSKINYKKVNFRVKKVGEIYLLPVRVIRPS